MKNIILTGDRPTGKLHLGHYVGSIKTRLELQKENNYDEFFIMIADAQALTDNFKEPSKVRENVFNIALDYLSCGLDPEKVTIFIQSEVSELAEISFYYQNLVNIGRLQRNPTVKEEIKQKSFEKSIPVGFLTYPISQASDITAFKANIIPVGEDQLPMIEQTREIVKTFNSLYGELLTEPSAKLATSSISRRLPGIDGNKKMSKSLNNTIYLCEEKESLKKKVMSMFTDPDHIKITDKGKVEGNIVFTYLNVFAKEEHFQKYLPEYSNLEELKNHYERGGLGDIKIKNFLFDILDELIAPIREKRQQLSQDEKKVYEILKKGTLKAKACANETLKEIKKAMFLNYFD